MRTLALLRALREKWLKDDVTRLSAAVAFFGLLAMAPLLLLVALLAQRFADPERVQDAITERAVQMFGADGADAVRTVLQNTDVLGSDPLVLVVGIGTLLFSASNLVIQLQRALNEVWDVAARADQNLKGLVIRRIIATALVLAVVLLLLSLPVLNALLDWLQRGLGLTSAGPWGDRVLLALLTAAACALLFKWLPDARIAWRDVALGAAVAAVLFTAAQAVMSRLLGSLTVASAFDAAGSIVVILLWTYVSTLILFLAAEVTQVVALWRERPVVPLDHAVARRREQRERREDAEEWLERAKRGRSQGARRKQTDDAE